MSMNLALLNVLVGAALPHLIAIVNQRKWGPQVKAGIAFGSCLVAAGITSYATGTLDLTDWGLAASAVFASAQISYKGLWHPLGTTTAIEEATSAIVKPPAPPKKKAATKPKKKPAAKGRKG